MFASVAVARRVFLAASLALTATAFGVGDALAQADPLPSWNDSAAKKAITDFVARVTAQGSADFISPAERVATFDNDGTLWAEQPIYFQFAFALDRVKALAPQHPTWKDAQPFKGLIEGDMKAFAASGKKGLPRPMRA